MSKIVVLILLILSGGCTPLKRPITLVPVNQPVVKLPSVSLDNEDIPIDEQAFSYDNSPEIKAAMKKFAKTGKAPIVKRAGFVQFPFGEVQPILNCRPNYGCDIQLQAGETVKALTSDSLAACYTFGSPMVGNEDFLYTIKPPIYRIINAYDPVPLLPTVAANYLRLLPITRDFEKKIWNYHHWGDTRYITPSDNSFQRLRVKTNQDELLRLIQFIINRKDSIRYHNIQDYCIKLAHYALERNETSAGPTNAVQVKPVANIALAASED